MTSVVDTSVKNFNSGMIGAPVLNGTAGSLIAVLNACLITGFDTKVATSLVVSGGVATLSFTGTHSAAVDSVVLVAGSSIAALNGEQKVTVIGSGVAKFATAAADGTASGTVSFKMAPAGWLQPFVGTNLAVYKSADLASTGMSIRIDDTGTTSARVVGYEQMTDVSTGTGQFPTNTDISGGGYIPKSNAASATAVRWYVVADGRGMVLSLVPYSATAAVAQAAQNRYIGDVLAFRPGGDPFAFSIGYGVNANYNGTNGLIDGAGITCAMPRAYHGLGGSVLHGSYPYTGSLVFSGVDTMLGAFPSEVDGGLRLSKRYLAVGANAAPRGDIPGVYTVPQSNVGASLVSGNVVNGTGATAGRRLLALSSGVGVGAPSSAYGPIMVDITGPWR